MIDGWSVWSVAPARVPACVSPLIVRCPARSLTSFPVRVSSLRVRWLARVLRCLLAPCVCVCAWVCILYVCVVCVHMLILVFVRACEQLHASIRVCVHLRVHAFSVFCCSCTCLHLCIVSGCSMARSLSHLFPCPLFLFAFPLACSPLASLSRLLRVYLCVCVHIYYVYVWVCAYAGACVCSCA